MLLQVITHKYSKQPHLLGKARLFCPDPGLMLHLL